MKQFEKLNESRRNKNSDNQSKVDGLLNNINRYC